MNRFAFLLSLLTISLGVFATNPTTIENPDYECRSTKVITFTKIERLPDATRFSVHAEFTPGWWIMVDSTAYIVDPVADIRYAPKAVEGLEMGKEFYMPESGQHDFTIVYPPIPSDVDYVDFEDGSWNIYGLRLDGAKTDKAESVDAEEWAAANIATYPGAPESFFTSGQCRVRGHINGYHPRLGFDNILLYDRELPTGQNKMKTININGDGSFDGSVDLKAPGIVYLNFGPNVLKEIYLEPGRDLAIYFDWDDILEYNITHKLSGVRFGGQLGRINAEISAAPKISDAIDFRSVSTIPPTEAEEKIKSTYKEAVKQFESYASANDIHPHSRKLIAINTLGRAVSQMLDYEMYRRNTESTDTISAGFYSLIEDIAKADDEWFFSCTDMSIIINRLAFSGMFQALGKKYDSFVNVPAQNPMHVLNDKGISLTEEERDFSEWIDMNAGKKIPMTNEEYMDFIDKINNIHNKIKENGLESEINNNEVTDISLSEYVESSLFPISNDLNAAKSAWNLGKTPLILQMMASARLCNFGFTDFRNTPKEYPAALMQAIATENLISDENILESLKTFYDKGMESIYGYYLPDDERGRIIADIIKPHQGKMLVIDMWGLYCGPCRSHIESSKAFRKANLDHPEFKYIFIADEEDAPAEQFNKYVAEHLQGEESHRLSRADYNRVRDLFNFNGIPRYILVGRDGKILDDNYSIHNLRHDLEEQGITLNMPSETEG